MPYCLAAWHGGSDAGARELRFVELEPRYEEMSMTSGQLALLSVAVFMPALVGLRLFVQRRRGTLRWERERTTFLGAILVVSSLALITAGGPFAQQLIPPVIVLLSGLWLGSLSGARGPRSRTLMFRAIAFMSAQVGLLWLIRAALVLSS